MGNPGQPCSTLPEGGYSLPGQERGGSAETRASPEPRAPELARASASPCQHVAPAWISCLELRLQLDTSVSTEPKSLSGPWCLWGSAATPPVCPHVWDPGPPHPAAPALHILQSLLFSLPQPVPASPPPRPPALTRPRHPSLCPCDTACLKMWSPDLPRRHQQPHQGT